MINWRINYLLDCILVICYEINKILYSDLVSYIYIYIQTTL